MGARRLAFALVLAAGAAQADYDPSQYPAYETCALCHGLFGVSHTAKFPNLAGQRPLYIETQLKAFLDGTRTNGGGQMVTIVSELKPQDIPIVVEWFSTQDPPEPSDLVKTEKGEALFADLNCATCHSNRPSLAGHVPYLSAQHAGYLLKQMKDFRDGDRTGHALASQHRASLSLDDTALEEIANYLSAKPRP